MTEFKRGVFARYQGKEYRARDNNDGTVLVTSRDPAEQENGFKLWGHGIYELTVLRSAVEALYKVKAFAVYKGVQVDVVRMEDGEVELGLCGVAAPPDEGWDEIGRRDFSKKVMFTELDRYWLEVKYF